MPSHTIIFFSLNAHDMGQTAGLSLQIHGRRRQLLCQRTPAATKEDKPANFSNSCLFIYLKEIQFPVMQ